MRPVRGALSLGAPALSIAFVIGLVACESATNLDVVYADASAAGEASSADAGLAEASPLAVFSGCPCDERSGLGCCIPAVGAPFCTGDSALCAEAKGVHVKCTQPDPVSESACCWRPATDGGAVSVAALAATCAGGSSACAVDTDCAGTGQTKCSLSTCAGAVTIGACGPTPPVCPQL
jgi:hypothetical protein